MKQNLCKKQELREFLNLCIHYLLLKLSGEAVGWGCSAEEAGKVEKGWIIHSVL